MMKLFHRVSIENGHIDLICESDVVIRLSENESQAFRQYVKHLIERHLPDAPFIYVKPLSPRVVQSIIFSPRVAIVGAEKQKATIELENQKSLDATIIKEKTSFAIDINDIRDAYEFSVMDI